MRRASALFFYHLPKTKICTFEFYRNNFLNDNLMKTIIELFETSVKKFSNNTYLWEKQNGKY